MNRTFPAAEFRRLPTTQRIIQKLRARALSVQSLQPYHSHFVGFLWEVSFLYGLLSQIQLVGITTV